MTGSLQDAEDLTQEALTKAWERFESFRKDAELATWVYQIATNTCLDFLRGKQRRNLGWGKAFPQYRLGEPLPAILPEILWLEPYPDPVDQTVLKDQVSLAYLALLQALPPRQRAVFIVTEVLGYTAKETADLLEMTPTAVNSALQRARKTIGPGVKLDPLDTSDQSELLARFMSAWEAGDAQAIVNLMRDDVRMVMPPYPLWVQGRPEVRQVLIDYPLNKGTDRWKLVPTVRANGNPAFGFYFKGDDGIFRGWGIQVVMIDQSSSGPARIQDYHVFKGPPLVSLFGLPDPWQE